MTTRTWTVISTYNGETDLQVMVWRWQRQAYRFVIDWFVDDEQLDTVSVVDDSGHADSLTLTRHRA